MGLVYIHKLNAHTQASSRWISHHIFNNLHAYLNSRTLSSHCIFSMDSQLLLTLLSHLLRLLDTLTGKKIITSLFIHACMDFCVVGLVSCWKYSRCWTGNTVKKRKEWSFTKAALVCGEEIILPIRENHPLILQGQGKCIYQCTCMYID